MPVDSFYGDLISGRDTGLWTGPARALLTVLAGGYGIGVRCRNFAFDRGWKRVHRAPVPVISVGNLTAGGTGKTPFVAYLANWFREQNVRVGLLSRGYRAHSDQGNDEKLVLDRLCPNVPHLQNPNRVESAQQAVSEHGCQLLLLDDGFQHRRLARDLDIVLIDALNPWGYGNLLPRGLLREPMSGLRRADLVVLTRADQCSSEQRQHIREQIAAVRQSDECVEVAFRPTSLVNSVGETQELAACHGQEIMAFCGIGNPRAFRQTLNDAGLKVASLQAFADHHHYSASDLNELAQAAERSNVATVMTTLKDLVKIDRVQLSHCPLWAVNIEAEVVIGDDWLDRRLEHVLALCNLQVTRTAG